MACGLQSRNILELNPMNKTNIETNTDAGQSPRVTRRIARHETTQRSAEIYQNRLYSRFDHVELVDWPRFSSTGTFIWEVA